MRQVMFVCLGNICRSPLAHAVFERMVDERGLEASYAADSSGTSGYHVGEPSDPRMRETARRHGTPIRHASQQLKRCHLDEFDLVVCMDGDNKHGALRLAKNDAQRQKVVLLRDYDPKGPGDVPDPYYGGPEGFEQVYEIVDRSASGLLDALEKDER